MPDTQQLQTIPNDYPNPQGMPTDDFKTYFQAMSDEYNRRNNIEMAPDTITQAAKNYVYFRQLGGESTDLAPLHAAVDAALPAGTSTQA